MKSSGAEDNRMESVNLNDNLAEEQPTAFQLETLLQPAESLKQPVVSSKQPAETPKQPAESSKQPAETPTQPAESPKQPAESSKQPAESSKQPAESPKQPAESPKQSAESSKQPAESSKQPAESSKQPAESSKQPAESSKQPAESSNVRSHYEAKNCEDKSDGVNNLGNEHDNEAQCGPPEFYEAKVGFAVRQDTLQEIPSDPYIGQQRGLFNSSATRPFSSNAVAEAELLVKPYSMPCFETVRPFCPMCTLPNSYQKRPVDSMQHFATTQHSSPQYINPRYFVNRHTLPNFYTSEKSNPQDVEEDVEEEVNTYALALWYQSFE